MANALPFAAHKHPPTGRGLGAALSKAGQVNSMDSGSDQEEGSPGEGSPGEGSPGGTDSDGGSQGRRGPGGGGPGSGSSQR